MQKPASDKSVTEDESTKYTTQKPPANFTDKSSYGGSLEKFSEKCFCVGNVQYDQRCRCSFAWGLETEG